MKAIWFKKSYRVHVRMYSMRLLATPHCIVFLMPVFAAIIRNGDYLNDGLRNMFAYISCITPWWK